MFELVADFERYPDFVPFCLGAKIRRRWTEPSGVEILIADMEVGYGSVRVQFTTRDRLDREKGVISVVNIDGPFRYFESHWSFRDLPQGGSRIDSRPAPVLQSGFRPSFLSPFQAGRRQPDRRFREARDGRATGPAAPTDRARRTAGDGFACARARTGLPRRRRAAVGFADRGETPLRRLLKFLHTMGAIGFMGALACLVVLATDCRRRTSLASYTLIRGAMASIATWIVLPSFGLTLVPGLLSIAVTRAFHNAGWAWMKAATGILIFAGGLHALAPIQEEAHLSAEALAGRLDPVGALGRVSRRAHDALGALFVSAANVALGVWRRGSSVLTGAARLTPDAAGASSSADSPSASASGPEHPVRRGRFSVSLRRIASGRALRSGHSARRRSRPLPASVAGARPGRCASDLLRVPVPARERAQVGRGARVERRRGQA